MKLKDLFRAQKKASSVQTASSPHPFQNWFGYIPLSTPDMRLYDAIREGVPIIDAALDKIVRLTGGFKVICSDLSKQKILDEFTENVPVGAVSRSLREFISIYLDSMLMYGNAVGEIVLDHNKKKIVGLYNAKLSSIEVKPGSNPMSVEFFTNGGGADKTPVLFPELILFTPLKPSAGEIRGKSLLKSLPFVSEILLKIFQATNNNFQRIGNLRYAVTYNPGSSPIDRVNSKEIAQSMAEQWQDVMSSGNNGIVKDFVAVGDVGIRVIGADNQIIDTEVPVRHMLEQIVAKLSIPPFMLGLHWSSTERMSTQQADILASELSSYRFLLESVIIKICRTFLRLEGSGATVSVQWENINLQDKLEEANVRLLNAQAASLEKEIGGENTENI